jgi:hypothetical protein
MILFAQVPVRVCTFYSRKLYGFHSQFNMYSTCRNEEIPKVAVQTLHGGQQQSDGTTLVVNVDERITMHGTCSAQNATLLWSFTPAVPPDLLQNRSIFPLGVSTTDLVILGARAAFIPGYIYVARLTCTTKRGLSSSAQMTLDITQHHQAPAV